MDSLRISAASLVSALGQGRDAHIGALREQRCGLRPCAFDDADLATWIGEVDAVDAVELPADLSAYACRNNKLAYLALADPSLARAVDDAKGAYGAQRIGVFVGTSTSGLQYTEHAYRARNPETGALPDNFRYRETQNGFSATDFVRRSLGLEGPSQSTLAACASSAKTFATAARSIALGFCDAAIVGGVDSLCLTTLYGFNALELVGREPCRPWDARREGISIGEAAGFVLIDKSIRARGDTALLGYGESLDAYHMSTPHPQGEGAALAMRRALACADLSTDEIDYVNLHGTATPANDAAEDAGMMSVFGSAMPCSATKGLFGHALGAAGIAEFVLSHWCIQEGIMPGTLNTTERDSSLSANLLIDCEQTPLRRVMSNSFGFGGSNCSLIVGSL